MSENTTVTQKDLASIGADLKKFWEPYLDSIKLFDAHFVAKLCYTPKEFNPDKIDCIRFFPWEINMGKDIYLELTNWDNELFHKGMRRLYKLSYDSGWEGSGKFLKVETGKGPSYILKVSDLEIINTSSVVAARPEVEFETKSEFSFEESLDEKFDEHFSKMTIRDFYCMLKNVPLSNKKWLNELIIQSNK